MIIAAWIFQVESLELIEIFDIKKRPSQFWFPLKEHYMSNCLIPPTFGQNNL
jgi:hypothetical protein